MAAIEPEPFHNDPLQVDLLPNFETVEFFPLEKNYLLKLNISTSIFLLVIAACVVVAYYFLPEFRFYWPAVVLFFFLFFCWNYFNNYQLQKRNGYAVRQRDVIYKRGFLFEKNIVVPFNRVQHVSTNRGVLDKMLNLATLKVFTAGGSGSDVSIPGLKPETANSLKEALSERMAGHV